MASDQEIAKSVASLLRQYDPKAVPSLSLNGIVKQLEAKLGLDLTERGPFIHELLRRFHPKDHFALQHPPQLQNSHTPLFHDLHPHPRPYQSSPAIPTNPFPSPLQHHEVRFQCSPPQQPQQQLPPQPSLAVATPLSQPQQQLAVPAASVPESPKERSDFISNFL